MSGLLAGLIVGLFAGYWAHWLTCWRDDRKRIREIKDPFGVFIQQQIDAIPEREVVEFYHRTKSLIRDEKNKIVHFLKSDERLRLAEVWKQYDEAGERLSEADNGSNTGGLVILKTFLGEDPELNYDRVRRLLNELYKFF